MSQDQPNSTAVMKAAFVQMQATAGWQYFLKFAETVIRDLETRAIAEDDDTKSLGYRRDARGARRFWEDIKNRVAIASLQNTEPAEDIADDFYAVVERMNERNTADA